MRGWLRASGAGAQEKGATPEEVVQKVKQAASYLAKEKEAGLGDLQAEAIRIRLGRHLRLRVRLRSEEERRPPDQPEAHRHGHVQYQGSVLHGYSQNKSTG